MDPASVIVVAIALLVTAAAAFVVFISACLAAWWFLGRGSRKTDAPAGLSAVVEVEETSAFAIPPRPDASDADAVQEPASTSAAGSTPTPLSADFGDLDEAGDLDTEDVAPTVRLQRPAVPTPAESTSADDSKRPPPLPVHWTDEVGDDEAVPTELFQVGMKSGDQQAIEADATEVFDAHQHEAFVIDDFSEGPRRS